MAQLNDDFPIGGMDHDSELRNVSKGDYLNAKNIRNAINAYNKGGTLTNIKGNLAPSKYCLPYNNGVWPSGNNKVIGSVEDTNYGTVLFFVWNSKGLHQILRYYRNLTSPANPYGEIHQVIQYNFGWSKTTKINSANIVYGVSETGAEDEETGDLLYWCDPVPKKINLTKAEICDKLKCWDLLLPVTIEGNIADTTTYTFKNFAGATIFSKTVNTSKAVSEIRTIQYIANGILGEHELLISNANFDLSGVTQISVVLGLYPATYTILGWTYQAFSNSTIVQVESYTAPDYFSEQVLLQWEVPESEARNFILEKIAKAFNDDAASPVTAEFCDCHLEFCEKVAGTVWTIVSDEDANIISASNWYGATLIDRFFDRCKWQPLNAPQAEFDKDLNYEPNYVQRKVFQFRLEYDYDDLERSALGVWSQIPINNLGCDGTSDKSYNYIDVDFNDTLIPLATTLVLLKRIRFIARELNTGADRAVISLEPCDFLDFRDGAWYCHFKFYNDIISSPIDTATAAKLFDNVPLETNDERFVKNRIVEGGILEGYDAPECVEAKVQMEFAENPNPELFTISGLIRIFNPFLDNNTTRTPETTEPNSLERRGPILYDTTQFPEGTTPYPCFGGAMVISSATELFMEQAVKAKKQLIPEGGWPVYAAGTDYFAISRQKIVNNVQQRSDGAMDVSNDGNKDQVKSLYQTTDDVYSNFELRVPAGEYIIRLASHWCSFGDKLGKGFSYNLSTGRSFQQTSTYVWGVRPDGGAWRYDYELRVTVTNSDVYVGEFVVSDLVVSNFDPIQLVETVSGYVFDNFGQVDVPALAKGVTVEKGLVKIINTGSLPAPIDFYQTKHTDHNGFFYLWYNQGSGDFVQTPANRVQVLQVPGTLIHNGGVQYFEDVLGLSALALLYAETISTDWQRGADGVTHAHREFICPVDNQDARSISSTFIDGRVVDSNGTPISGLTVLYEHGRTTLTQTDGTYSLLAWGDLTVGPTNNNRTVDNLFYNGDPSCLPTYPNGQEYTPVLIDPFGANTTDTPPPYSDTAIYDVPDFIVNHGSDPSIKAHKRGGNYTYAGRGYDSAGRLCSCFFLSDAYVPFITEDIGKYGIEDFSNAVYPSDTFRYGKPSLRVVLDANTVFPTWMKYFQLMRVKNSIYGRYLQWVANQVTYVAALATTDTPEIKTVFGNRDATAIKISLSNIVDYSAQNNDSLVGYAYQAGDRVRLITNRSLVQIDGLNDFEVTSYDSTTQEIIIKPNGFTQELQSGMLFEIFNPKSVSTSDSQIFYEVGEVVKVNGGIPEAFIIPLTNGDTYWRGRLITVNDEATKFAAAYPVVIEDASVSDFYPSEAQDIGRIGIIDPAFKQVYAPTKMRCSNPFLPSTAVNGLSSFEELNQVELDRSNGQIERLLQKENTVIAVTSEREVSTYIEVVSFQQADVGSGVLAIANQYFGTQYPHARRLGTDHPSSVFINDGQAFGLQSKRGEVWRYQGDGELSISNEKMINYFKQLEQDGVSDAVAVYDRYHKEGLWTIWREYQQESTITNVGPVSITVPFTNSVLPISGEEVTVQYLVGSTWYNVTGVVGLFGSTWRIAVFGVVFTVGQQVNIVYSVPETVVWFNGEVAPNKNRWVRMDSRTPEAWQQCGSELVSFKDGRVWLENVNPIYNNFYGVQYETSISPVFNDEPKINKYWSSLWMEQFQSDKKCNWRADRVYNTNNQLSRLKAANWVKREQDWFIDFKRNLNDSTVTNPIVNGNVLRSSALVVELQNSFTGEITLYGWRCMWTQSPRTIK